MCMSITSLWKLEMLAFVLSFLHLARSLESLIRTSLVLKTSQLKLVSCVCLSISTFRFSAIFKATRATCGIQVNRSNVLFVGVRTKLQIVLIETNVSVVIRLVILRRIAKMRGVQHPRLIIFPLPQPPLVPQLLILVLPLPILLPPCCC